MTAADAARFEADVARLARFVADHPYSSTDYLCGMLRMDWVRVNRVGWEARNRRLVRRHNDRGEELAMLGWHYVPTLRGCIAVTPRRGSIHGRGNNNDSDDTGSAGGGSRVDYVAGVAGGVGAAAASGGRPGVPTAGGQPATGDGEPGVDHDLHARQGRRRSARGGPGGRQARGFPPRW